MRLYNIYYLCKEYEDTFLNFSIRQTNISNVYKIERWEEYKKGLSVIRKIVFLQPYVDALYDIVPVFVREKKQPEIDSVTRNALLDSNKGILNKIQAIIELYESLNLGEGLDGVDVKIPKCDSLGEYISYLKDIDFIFEQCPFLQHKDGIIKFKNVDVGSQWLTFLIVATSGTAAVTYILNNLAMLLDKAVQLKSHLINLREQEEIVRSKKLGNDALESSLEMFDALKRHYLSEAVKDLEEKNTENPLKDGEEKGKVEKSLEKLCGLLEKGVEIYASIDTDKDIQVLFPALGDKVELPGDILGLIEDKEK